MYITQRQRFFNFFRQLFFFMPFEKLLTIFTQKKGYNNFFVKCIPQNYQYKKGSIRKASRDGINYRLDISEYMEWVIYFGLAVEERSGLFSLIKPGQIIFDVGTNIGETLLNFAKLTGKNGYVFGFEPVDINYKKCIENISINSFQHIKVSQVALSDKKEILYFGYSDNKNSGGIFMQKERQKNGTEVQALTLDEFVEIHTISKIDLIKIDVEGFEYHVLAGAKNSLNKFKPVLFVEVDQVNLQRQNSSSGNLIALITSYGYTCKSVDGEIISENYKSHFDMVCKPI